MIDLGTAIPYTITIEPTKNKGFVVRVGCAVLAYESKEKLINDLRAYLDDPELYMKEYANIPLSHMLNMPQNEQLNQRSEVGWMVPRISTPRDEPPRDECASQPERRSTK